MKSKIIMKSKEFEWFVKHSTSLKKYSGKHIAIIGDRVVAIGDTFIQVFEEAKRKFPDKEPMVTFVPKRKALMYGAGLDRV